MNKFILKSRQNKNNKKMVFNYKNFHKSLDFFKTPSTAT